MRSLDPRASLDGGRDEVDELRFEDLEAVGHHPLAALTGSFHRATVGAVGGLSDVATGVTYEDDLTNSLRVVLVEEARGNVSHLARHLIEGARLDDLEDVALAGRA